MSTTRKEPSSDLAAASSSCSCFSKAATCRSFFFFKKKKRLNKGVSRVLVARAALRDWLQQRAQRCGARCQARAAAPPQRRRRPVPHETSVAPTRMRRRLPSQRQAADAPSFVLKEKLNKPDKKFKIRLLTKVDLTLGMQLQSRIRHQQNVWRITNRSCGSACNFSTEQKERKKTASPMLLKKTSDMTGRTGSTSNTWQSCMVTGTTNRMVVTLSKNAERNAVNKQSKATSRHKRPRESLYIRTAQYSKNPVVLKMPTYQKIDHLQKCKAKKKHNTMIIIPNSNPHVSQSTQVIISSKEGLS